MRYPKKAVKPTKHIKAKKSKKEAPKKKADFSVRVPYLGNVRAEGNYSDLLGIGSCVATGNLACVASGLYNIAKFV